LRKVVPKTSFLGGEAGYLLEGRSDLAQYQLGTSPGKNFIYLKGGGATRRPGSRFVRATTNDKPAVLLDFITSYDSGSKIFVIEVTKSNDATPVLVFTAIRISDNTTYTASAGTSSVQLALADIANFDLDSIQYVQSADAMFITGNGIPPLVLFTDGASTPSFVYYEYMDNNLAFSTRPLQHARPYRDPNVSAVTMQAGATSGNTTLTASVAFFNAGHVGAYFRITESATNGYVRVTGFTSSTVVDVTVVVNLGGTSAVTDWQESAWSKYRGWPRTVTLYNSRLVFGGNTSQPDTFWASQQFDYYQMWSSTANIDDPQVFALNSTRLNQIRWMVGGKKLTIGTSSSEWVGVFREDGTNLFVEFDEETSHGSSPIQANRSAYTVPFVQRSGQTIREMVFDFDSDNYIATDMNLFASHIGTAYGDHEDEDDVAIKKLAFQESPFNILWVLDNYGRLYGLTRDKQQQIASWHSHELGGIFTDSAIDYPARVMSMCVVPDTNGKRDRLWMVVKRTINSVTKYHIEYIDDIKKHSTLSVGSATDIRSFLDCASISTAAATSTWAGFTRFASTNAYVIAESTGGLIVYSGLLAVNGSGEFTLPNSITATKVCVGLHADAELRLLPMEGGDAPEISLLATKNPDTAAIRLYQTWGLRIGPNRILRITGIEEASDFEPIPFDSASTPQFSTFTGVKEVQVPTGEDHDGSFALAMQEPWPCTILAISSRVVAHEV
jgi:hypothetical protein